MPLQLITIPQRVVASLIPKAYKLGSPRIMNLVLNCLPPASERPSPSSKSVRMCAVISISARVTPVCHLTNGGREWNISEHGTLEFERLGSFLNLLALMNSPAHFLHEAIASIISG